MFENREQAGYQLAQKLDKFSKVKSVVVLGLARGGVVVAKVVSTYLNAKLDTLVVKKIGAPNNEELAIGGIAPGNTVFWNEELVRRLRIKPAFAERLRQGKQKEREEQEKELRGERPLEISGKTVILVDDGVATGASVIAASLYLERNAAKKSILAVPVIAKDTLSDIERYFDMIVVLKIKKDFQAVGQFYKEFPQVENGEVIKLLR